jgi:hypothetical protein
MNDDRRFTFPEREYYRSCAMCGFIADPGYPWDEKLQRMEYCPRCSIPLERLACQSCGAPVVVASGYSMFGGREHMTFPACGYCGEPVTRAEPKLRTKPQTVTRMPTGSRAMYNRMRDLFAIGFEHSVTIRHDDGDDGGRHPRSIVLNRYTPWAGCVCDKCQQLRAEANRPMSSTIRRRAHLRSKGRTS